MRPGSQFLADLEDSQSRLGEMPVVSYCTPMDLPEPDAYAEEAALRRTVLLASLAVLGVVLALAGSLARALGRGLSRIKEADRALGSGDLSERLPPGGADEIGAVSRTFNAMAEELAGARGRLEHWNEELQRDVEARARALREAQGQVVEAQKLAAIGQLVEFNGDIIHGNTS